MVAFFVGGLALVGIILSTAYPEWTRNSQVSSQPFLRGQRVFRGLWWRCYSGLQGLFQCDFYDTSIIGIEGKFLLPITILFLCCAQRLTHMSKSRAKFFAFQNYVLSCTVEVWNVVAIYSSFRQNSFPGFKLRTRFAWEFYVETNLGRDIRLRTQTEFYWNRFWNRVQVSEPLSVSWNRCRTVVFELGDRHRFVRSSAAEYQSF